jgi:peptide/nickel transport system permease protein
MTEHPSQAAHDQLSAGLKRRRNWPLIIGFVLVLCIFLLAVFGPSVALRDPLETNTVVKVGDEWIRLPYPPFAVPGFPLGSDAYGRDLSSRLLWGIRPTLILVTVVACVRLVLGVIIGLAAGWSSGRWGRILEGVMSGALAIPVIIVSLAVITAIGIQRGLIAFIVGLTVTGWAETARLVSEQTRGLRNQPYVEASGALGATGLETLARHVVRQISPLFGMLLAFEAGSTLMAVAALGFLGYYVGGAFWVEVTDFSTRAISGMPELGQMLANSWQIFKPWATVATGTVIFLAVLGFSLVGEGLRRRLSMGELGRRTPLSNLSHKAGAWVDELLLVPGVVASQRRRTAGLAILFMILVCGLLIWRPWQQRGTPTGGVGPTQTAVAIPGGHLWANERRDAAGTLASPITEAPAAAVRWILPDPTGFSGGPAVDAQGNVYATSNGGTLYALTPAGDMRWQSALPADPVGVPALGIVPAAAGQPASALYVTDKAGGLSAFTPDGEFLWRTKTKTGRRASSGPVVGGDGTVYYTVVDRVEAVSSGGQPLWTSAKLPGQGERPPRLDPNGRWLYVQDVAVNLTDGSLADLSSVVMAGQAGVNAVYMIGGDGKKYLRESHAVFPWQPTAAGGERTGKTTWTYQNSTVYLPLESGVSGRGNAWLHYGSQYDDLRLVLLGMDGQMLLNAHYPQRPSQVIATDAADHIYVCGENRAGSAECVGFAPGAEAPFWQVALPQGGQVNGGALVPGRLYVTTSDGALYALGDT